MSVYLSVVLFSFFVHFVSFIPFINFLYKMKFQRQKQITRDVFGKLTPIFDKFHSHKQGTPVGGGILIFLLTSFLYVLFLFIFYLVYAPKGKFIYNYPNYLAEVKIILITFFLFFILGLYDDLNKIFFWQKKQFFGLRLRHKLFLEILFSFVPAYLLYKDLKVSIIHIPFLGVLNLGIFFIPFVMFVIVAFSNAVNITDGLDGLAGGVLLISLSAFWAISRAIFDVPTLLFIAIWIGGLLAFLYFNIYPARIFLGDSGALSFGATFAVIGIILGKTFAMPIISGVVVLEVLSSLLQLVSKKFFRKKLFPVAPLHLYLQYRGWPEPKVVMRLWLVSILFAVLGLAIAFLK